MPISSGGRSAAINTITMVTSPALGMLAAPTLARVAVRLQLNLEHLEELSYYRINILKKNCIPSIIN